MNQSSRVQDLEWLADGRRWRGRVTLKGRLHPRTILVFQEGERWLGISARCPHEGHDLSDCPLDAKGQLICPVHGLPIQILGPASVGIPIHRVDDDFWVTDDRGESS